MNLDRNFFFLLKTSFLSAFAPNYKFLRDHVCPPPPPPILPRESIRQFASILASTFRQWRLFWSTNKAGIGVIVERWKGALCVVCGWFVSRETRWRQDHRQLFCGVSWQRAPFPVADIAQMIPSITGRKELFPPLRPTDSKTLLHVLISKFNKCSDSFF